MSVRSGSPRSPRAGSHRGSSSSSVHGGGGAAPYGVSGAYTVIDEATADRFMRLPRHTLSARPANRHARGVDAVLLSFDKKVQLALRQLCFERLEIEARRAAVLERLAATEQGAGDRLPDVLVRLNTQLADSDYNIRWLAKGSTPVLLAALQEPEVRASLSLPVATEEDSAAAAEPMKHGNDDPRVWRRRLETRKITRVDAPYRRVTHDTPTHLGNRSLANELNSRNPEDGLSYYQKQTLRYGRSRRGSTSIAGEGGCRVCAAEVVEEWGGELLGVVGIE